LLQILQCALIRQQPTLLHLGMLMQLQLTRLLLMMQLQQQRLQGSTQPGLQSAAAAATAAPRSRQLQQVAAAWLLLHAAGLQETLARAPTGLLQPFAQRVCPSSLCSSSSSSRCRLLRPANSNAVPTAPQHQLQQALHGRVLHPGHLFSQQHQVQQQGQAL
jgi:hypothetical protein